MLKYDIRTGVSKIKTKTAIVLSAVVMATSGFGMAIVIPAASHAADYCGSSSNGCANSGALDGSCAGHGAFGAFGDKGNVVHDFGHVYPGDSNGKPGANGYQTGVNNGTLCGNRQGNLPE